VTVAESASQPTRCPFALFVQQWDHISTDTERRAVLSAIAELLFDPYLENDVRQSVDVGTTELYSDLRFTFLFNCLAVV